MSENKQAAAFAKEGNQGLTKYEYCLIAIAQGLAASGYHEPESLTKQAIKITDALFEKMDKDGN